LVIDRVQRPVEGKKANPLESLAQGVFVGRTEEIAAGRAMLDDALSGRAGFLLLTGEIGIGKTRLADELATYASLQGAAVLWGASYPDQGARAYWPWIQALRSYVRYRDADQLGSELGSGGPEVAKVLPEVRERLPDMAPPSPGNLAEERFRLFAAMTSFLRNASAAQPLVVVLDNVHYADLPTLHLAQFLLQESKDARLLLIGTYREVEAGRRHPTAQVLADLALNRRFRRRTLWALSKQNVGRLIEAQIGQTPSPVLLDRVYDVTRGMPLFVVETVRLLAQEGRLWSGGAGVSVPQSVRGVIGKRLDRLSEQANQLLIQAAVAGREFDLTLLREMSGQSEDQIMEFLEQAVASRLLEEVKGAVRKYRFVHGLTRQVLTADISASRRARLHARVGETMEEIYEKEAPGYAAELAYHFEQAAALSVAQEKAVHYAVLSAQVSEVSFAYEEVIRHYESAMALMDDIGQEMGQDRLVLLRGLATTQRHVYLIAPAFRNFRRAMRLAQQRGNRQQVAELALEQAITGAIPNQIAAATLNLGLEAVPDPDSELAGIMHVLLGSRLNGLHRRDEASEHRELAENLAKHHQYVELELVLAQNKLAAASGVLDFQQWPALLQRLQLAEQAAGHLIGMATSPGYSGGTTGFLSLGDVAKAQKELERFLEPSRRARDPYRVVSDLTSQAAIYASKGRWQQMSLALKEADRWMGDEFFTPTEIARGTLSDAQGNLNEARTQITKANVLQHQIHLSPILPAGSMVVLSGLERRAGDQKQADASYQFALDTLQAGPEALQVSPSSWAGVHTFLALEAAARGDAGTMARCRAVLTPHTSLMAVQSNMWGLPVSIRRALGVMAMAEQRWGEAVGYLEETVRFCGEKGLVVELAHARLALSDACRGRNGPDDRRRAATVADEALVNYRRLGMPMYVRDALIRCELLRV
jgi:tetratricopeptide (TPR) repeat protein